MRIIFVLVHYYPYIGGAEEAFRRLAEGLASRGHSIIVITSKIPGSSSYEVQNGVEIHRINIPWFAHQYLFTLFSLPIIFNNIHNYDLVHTESNYSALSAFICALSSHKPLLFTCHEVLGERWYIAEKYPKSMIYRLIENIIVHLPYHQYIAVSDSTRCDLERVNINPKNISVINWGLNQLFPTDKVIKDGRLRRRCGIGENSFLYVYYGRPGATKGVEYLIRAVPEISKNIPDSHLALILSTEPRSRYRYICNLISKLSLEKIIHILMPIQERVELACHLADANCIVIPSITEGFGLTTAEACELKIPIVASRVGAIPKLVSGSFVLIPPASSHAIAQGVINIWKGNIEHRERSENLTWDNTIRQYEKLYGEVKFS